MQHIEVSLLLLQNYYLTLKFAYHNCIKQLNTTVLQVWDPLSTVTWFLSGYKSFFHVRNVNLMLVENNKTSTVKEPLDSFWNSCYDIWISPIPSTISLSLYIKPMIIQSNTKYISHQMIGSFPIHSKLMFLFCICTISISQ